MQVFAKVQIADLSTHKKSKALFTRHKLTRVRPDFVHTDKYQKYVYTQNWGELGLIFHTQASWLHSQVKLLYSVIKSIVL